MEPQGRVGGSRWGEAWQWVDRHGDETLLIFKMEKTAMNQGMWVALEAGKDDETDSSRELPEGIYAQ